MDHENVAMGSKEVRPFLFLPKTCTPLVTECDMSDNIYIQVNITTPDTTGNQTCIYSGLCNVKLFDSYNDIQNCLESTRQDFLGSSVDIDADQMPIIFSDASQASNQEVWIDPCRSPYVYNRSEPPPQETSCIRETAGCITVRQHNTYITQNIYKYKEPNNTYTPASPTNDFEHRKFKNMPEVGTSQQDSNMNCYGEEEFECGVFLSHLPEEILIEEQNKAREECNLIDFHSENSALKQLMSTSVQSKQRKTIMFVGNDSESGQTIQKISYNDPKMTCEDLEVDQEVVIGNSKSFSLQKKKYQCGKCKKIFKKITGLHKHMFRKHTDFTSKLQNQPHQTATFICIECGKTLKTQLKFEIHCLGHGDPDLECPKCHKVYASKYTLRCHLKIHTRRFSCSHCIRTYSRPEELKTHMEKTHYMMMCQYEECLFKTCDSSELIDHHNNHISMKSSDNDFDEVCLDIINDDATESQELIKEADWKCKSDDEPMDEDGNSIKINDDQNSINNNDDQNSINNNDDQNSIKNADSVIAKVMSNKVFLLNSKKAYKTVKGFKKCEVCYKTFDRISDLKRHLIEHVVRSTLAKSPAINGLLHLTCEVCKTETFTKIDKYKAHLREHAKLTIYKCVSCDKSFSDSSNFSKHKKTHVNTYFQCDLCQRKFHTKKTISQHMEHHRKTAPVKCRCCNKMFHFTSTLKKHMKSAHNKTSSTLKFNCRFCADVFKTLKGKWDHEWGVHRIRKMIVDCRMCGAKFRKYTELKRHCYDVHRTEIPLACVLKNGTKHKRIDYS